MKKNTQWCGWLVLVFGVWACTVQLAAQKTDERILFDSKSLTPEETIQTLNETKEFLLIKEIPALTDPYFSYWIINTTTQKIVTKGNITKGDIIWQNTYTLKLTKLPEVMPDGKTKENFEMLIDITKNK
ncbi:MAG: hypothetical protein MUF68_01830 [Cyclobacteriaceae bacterium]|jgi:hypothetical protein|nr:hypothetical protein [Cyclobacteriaceae bacterium]